MWGKIFKPHNWHLLWTIYVHVVSSSQYCLVWWSHEFIRGQKGDTTIMLSDTTVSSIDPLVQLCIIHWLVTWYSKSEYLLKTSQGSAQIFEAYRLEGTKQIGSSVLCKTCSVTLLFDELNSAHIALILADKACIRLPHVVYSRKKIGTLNEISFCYCVFFIW